MMWFWILFAISSGAVAQDILELFRDVSLTTIKGELTKGHHDCYLCDDPRIKNSHLSPTRLELLVDETRKEMIKISINSAEVCCIPQSVLKVSEYCGERVPTTGEGFPKIDGEVQERKTARSILHGEYPWRAFLYRKDDGEDKNFCAGTAVGDKRNHVLTTVNCASMYPASQIAVSFIRSMERLTYVDSIIIHPDYNNKNPYVNNIALLVLDQTEYSVLYWVKPACTSSLPPMHATTCTTMSDNDNSTHTFVPMAKYCENVTMNHISLMCSTVLKSDYDPEIGSGLFCQEPRTQTDKYFVSGITLARRGELIIYTNVSYFAGWIAENT